MFQCVIVMAVVTLGQVQKSDLAAHLKNQQAAASAKRKEAIDKLSTTLSAARKGTITRVVSEAKVTTDAAGGLRYQFPNLAVKTDTVEKLAKQLSDAEKAPNHPPLPELVVSKMAVGHVGRLRGVRGPFDPESESRQLEVLEILSNGEALVRMGKRIFVTGLPGGTINEDTRKEFVLKTDTTGLVDEAKIDVGDQCYEVTGTQSASGRTVFTVQKLDPAPFIPK